MHTVIWFLLGSMFGCMVGVFTMCLLQAARSNNYEEEFYEKEKC